MPKVNGVKELFPSDIMHSHFIHLTDSRNLDSYHLSSRLWSPPLWAPEQRVSRSFISLDMSLQPFIRRTVIRSRWLFGVMWAETDRWAVLRNLVRIMEVFFTNYTFGVNFLLRRTAIDSDLMKFNLYSYPHFPSCDTTVEAFLPKLCTPQALSLYIGSQRVWQRPIPHITLRSTRIQSPLLPRNEQCRNISHFPNLPKPIFMVQFMNEIQLPRRFIRLDPFAYITTPNLKSETI